MNTNNHTQYIIKRKLGEGGMGIVYLAEDTLLERLVAVKELNIAAVPVSEQVGNRFQQEALALARLNHPNITHLYAFLPKEDTYWMVMEYVNGKTLEEWLHISGSVQPHVACSIVVQVLDGLYHAHRKGIIHRDLKPANVMISEEGEVKIMDFGIARIRNSQRMTMHGKSVGTLEYMAPEQIQGKEGDERTDIYAAGNILYELLCGQPPFRADTDYHLMKAKLEDAPPLLPALATVTPQALKHIILKALERNPAKRFATVTEFRDSLIQCIQHSLLNQYELIQVLSNPAPASHERSNVQQQPSVLNKWKSNAAAFSSGFLDDLSYHSRQVSGQLAKLFSLAINIRKKDFRYSKNSVRKSFSRIPTLVNDHPIVFLIIIVFICGILLVWKNSSDNSGDLVYSNNTTPVTLVKKQDSINQENNVPNNSNLIETQLSKVPPPITGENDLAEEDEDVNLKTPPKEKSVKKKPDPSKGKSLATDNTEEGDEIVEDVHEPEPSPKKEPSGPVNIPSGRSISLVLDENLSSEQPERDGDPIRLRCYEDIKVEGRTVIRKGAYATGKIVDVVPSNKRRKAMIGFVIQKIEASDGSTLKVHSERFQMVAQSPGTPVIYKTGQVFFAKLGRGRLD